MKRKTYRKALIICTIICASLSIIFLGYVFTSMITYERNLVDNYISYLATSGKLLDKVNDDLFKISEYEVKDAKITDGVKKLYKSDNLKIKVNKEKSIDNIYTYDLYNNDLLISTVSLKSTKEYKKMGILKINEWEIVDYENHFENGIYAYEVTIPQNYELYINDKLVSKDLISETSDVKELEDLTEYVSIDKRDTYKINNLVYEPNIKIKDENAHDVKYTVKDNKIEVKKEFIEVKDFEEAKKYLKADIDILKLAENYSLFLTDDLGGERHGLYKLTPYLIEGNKVYERAYQWSRGIDITFVSDHRLKNPIFTNEKLENVIIYNEDAFSVEVYLEKNMVILSNSIVGSHEKKDILHDRYYFVYYDGGYKWVKTEAITD